MAGVKGRSGPRPKPAALHKAQGTYIEDRHGAQLHAPPGMPLPPPELTAEEMIAFDRLAVALARVPGLLSSVDWCAVSICACAWVEYARANSRIAREGAILKGKAGGAYQNPWVGVRNKAADTMQRAIAAFGMSPRDRAAIRGLPQTGEQRPADSPFERFLALQKN